MRRELINTDIRGQMVLLGTGTSVGVPVIGCGCDGLPQRRIRGIAARGAARFWACRAAIC